MSNIRIRRPENGAPRLRPGPADAAFAERIRLAMDLHDGVLQSLAAVKYRLHAAKTEQGARQKAAIDGAIDIIAHEQRLLRSFIEAAAKQGPGEDQSASVPLSAIVEDIRRIADAWGCSAGVSCQPAHAALPCRFAEQIGLLMREAISNAVRHADVRNLSIDIACPPGAVRIEMKERRAFPSSAPQFKPRSLEARVTALNGSMSIFSSPDEVTIAFAIPTHDGC